MRFVQSFIFLFAFFIGKNSFAQNGFISGTLTDSIGSPIEGASIGIAGTSFNTLSNSKGFFTLEIPAGSEIKISFSSLNYFSYTETISLKAGESKTINRKLRQRTNTLQEANIIDKSLRDGNVTRINPKYLNNLPTPNQSVEDIIKTLPGVSSNNELSSTYNVRGGNFDENLVYVNDIEVIRPFLVRSGQQEGLSFINPDMVENINFSAGGFDAKYGDKLSSVLDIKYKQPKKFSVAASASLLGGSLEIEDANKDTTFTIMAGIRQKSTQYLLNTFETRGEYKPSFTDVQLLTTFKFSNKVSAEVFGNYARNIYNLVPENRETNFGSINDAKRFTVYFDGQEKDKFISGLGAASLTFKPNDSLKIKMILSSYAAQEEENFDILGQYLLDQLESDLGKDNFGDVAFNLGVGSFLNHARNKLETQVSAVEHKGEIVKQKSLWLWGVKAQHEEINDKLSEYNYNDSAGFSIPSPRDSINPQLIVNDVIKSKAKISSNRFNGYLQHSFKLSDSSGVSITAGVRASYWDYNEELNISPRLSFHWNPDWKNKMTFGFASGFYYQPPFYRELRNYYGIVQKDVKAQKSIHFVLNNDYTFLALRREFKLTTEIYYKVLEDINPYKIDNLRIKYLANNNAKGYAYGIDMRLFGEFVPGTESWMSISFLNTKEDISNDVYYIRLNADGDTIIPGYTFDQIATDSIKNVPGYLPRPADQRLNVGLFFQDYFPNAPTYKMFLSLHYGTGLPFGPPGPDRYKDVLRTTSYKRVDIGFSKQLLGEDVKRKPQSNFLKKFESAWISLEVFNLLQISNVSGYLWVTDVTQARQYAVPNYLTGRQLNLRLSARF